MDVLFIDSLQFVVPRAAWARCSIAASREETLRQAMEHVGLELIDYNSFTVETLLDNRALVRAFSRQHRERLERLTASL